MTTAKSNLRQTLKKARLEMTKAEHTVRSRHIVERLKDVVDWSKIQAVHYFEPIQELLEPDISDFIVWLEDTHPAVQLFAPKLIGGQWQMISITDEEPPDAFDVVLVPMLGFDDCLHRIGYGGGYYDVFLATQPQAQKIGVCFELGHLTELIPTEPHDIAVDLILTEQNQYKQ